jgi:uncharacterized protein
MVAYAIFWYTSFYTNKQKVDVFFVMFGKMKRSISHTSLMKGGKGMGLHMITFILLVIGGLNWLIFGIWGTDLGAWLGGMDATISRVIYVLVGLSAVYELVVHKKSCACCGVKGGSGGQSAA